MRKLGLVTVLYNSESVLKDFFASLKSQTLQNFKLYLIDNSASIESTHLLNTFLTEELLFEYEHIVCKGNLGVAEGNNIGIRKSIEDKCEFTVLLNNDIIIENTDFLAQLLNLHIKNEFDIIVPKIFYPDRKSIWYAGGYFDRLRALGVHRNFKKIDDNLSNCNQLVTYSPTCFMSIKNSVFDTVGLMDSTYFVYTDDTDFVYRCIQLGIKLWYVPELVITHLVSVSSGGDDSKFYIFYSNRNKIYFIRKHYTGIRKYISIGYHLLARVVFYLKFNSAQRQSLLNGLREGFKLKL
ncbi:MAG: glycosyltransferase family 2 protein [Chitinophagales bacterium]|nr:glycosyltransferase family 2 protein [Chitinophagales bacterium]